MPFGNTANSYGSVTKTFHWLTVLLIFTLIPVGLIAHNMAENLRGPAIGVTPEYLLRTIWIFSLHKTLGVTVFFVALARVLWSVFQPKPDPLSDDATQTRLADMVHWVLYGTLILTPLTGWAHHAATIGFAPIWWPFGQSLPFIPKSETVATTFAGLHGVMITLLVLSILLHVAGTLKHQFINRDATLRRMLPRTRDLTPTYPRHRSSLPAMAALAVLIIAICVGVIF
jgi:cytochrome b561